MVAPQQIHSEQAQLVIEVHDNGAGVDEAQREHIFEPFVVLNRARGGAAAASD